MGAAHDHADDTQDGGNLKVAFALNLGFTLLEFAGGLWTNSVAILSDAVHDSGDSVSLDLAWYLQRLSGKEGDRTFSYGYRRFSVLGALITGLVLLAGIAYVLWRAIPRLHSPEAIHAAGMAVIAVVGIVANGAAVLALRGGTSLNESVVSWHLLEDLLGWVAVLIGSVVMAFWDVPILDPLLSIAISLFVLWNVAKKLRQVFRVFLQSAPAACDLAAFEQRVRALPGARFVHHSHPWTVDGEHHVLTTHVVIGSDATREDAIAAKRRVCALLGDGAFEHITVEVEFGDDDCSLADGPIAAKPG